MKILKMKVGFYFFVHNVIVEQGFWMFSCLKVCFNDIL